MSKELNIERPLGSHEEMYWRLDAGQSLNFTVRATISGGLTPDLTRGALDALQQRYPKLRVKIISKRGRPFFRHTAVPIPLRVFRGDEAKALALMEENINQPYDTTAGPLMRVSQVIHGANKSSVLFSFHHSISDGRSTLLMFKDFILYAEKLFRGEVLVVESRPMVPAFEDLLPAEVKGWRGFILLLRAMGRLARGVLATGFPFRSLPKTRRSSLDERQVVVFEETLEPDVTENLIKLARRHNTTLHGALHAAFVLSACHEISAEKSLNLFAGTVTDIRSTLSDEAVGAAGLFATVAGGPIQASSKDSLWQLAQELRTRLLADVESQMNLILTLLPYRVSNWVMRMIGPWAAKPFMNILDASHPPTIPLSNLGAIEYSEFGGVFDIEKLCIVSAPSILGTVSGHAVTVKGRLNLSVGGSAPTINPAMIQRYLSRAVQMLVREAEACIV